MAVGKLSLGRGRRRPPIRCKNCRCPELPTVRSSPHLPYTVPDEISAVSFINARSACAAWVTVLGLSVCLSTFILELQETKRHMNGTLVFRRSKYNVADLAKTAASWQEKEALPWTTFRDPTHQLAW